MFKINKKEIFRKISSDAIKNIVFFGFATFVIYFIVNSLKERTFALFLAGIFLIAILVSLVSFLITLITSLILIPSIIIEMRNGNDQVIGDEMWIWGGVAFRLAEELVCLYYVYKLFVLFF